MTCEVCPLCVLPLNPEEKLLYEDNTFFIVQTKDLKGHGIRMMVCTKSHIKDLPFLEQVKGICILVKYMEENYPSEKWVIVEGTYASTPEHWHYICCDKNSTDLKEQIQFQKTPKVEFPIKIEKSKKILVGIPAYNEEKTIGEVVNKAKKYGDIMVVDDGSTDKTSDVALSSGAGVTKNDQNYGYGYSIAKIFREAKTQNYDVLITLDADGQHNPDEIPTFLDALNPHTDVVIGNRFLAHTPIPCVRSFGVFFISKLEGYPDAQCGFRAYSKKAIENINIKEKGMGASLEILQQAKEKGLRISEVPCTINYTKTTHTHNPLKHGSILLEAFLWSKVWRKPHIYLGLPSLFFLLVGFLSTIQMLSLYVQYKVFVISWTALSLGGLISGLVLLSSSTLLYLLKRALEETK